MALASFEDANNHLDETKLKFADDPAAAEAATEADRLVRAALADTFPDHAYQWEYDDIDTPTPELVREVASLLMASYTYNKVYSEESMEPNPYAEKLEARAWNIINGIIDGTLVLVDVDYGADAAVGLEQANFWPNNKTTDAEARAQEEFRRAYPGLGPSTKFRMGQEF